MHRTALLFSVATLGVAGAASAHPLPRAASPAPNAALTAPPSEVRITFSEGLVAAFSGLALTDAAGHAVPLGPAVVQDKDILAAPIKAPLADGTYTVNWHAVGDDTHHVSGHYSFRVAR